MSLMEFTQGVERVGFKSGEGTHTNPTNKIENNDKRKVLEEEIEKLPEFMQEIIYHTYFDGFKDYEIAQILRKDRSIIKANRGKALRIMKKNLENYGGKL